MLVRWGGEVFLIVSRFTDRAQATILAERVMEAVKGKPFMVGPEGGLRQTCSIGWAAYPWIEDNPEAMEYHEVLKYADRGLYRAKKAGKDQAVGMTPYGSVESILDSAQSRTLRQSQPEELELVGQL